MDVPTSTVERRDSEMNDTGFPFSLSRQNLSKHLQLKLSFHVIVQWHSKQILNICYNIKSEIPCFSNFCDFIVSVKAVSSPDREVLSAW